MPLKKEISNKQLDFIYRVCNMLTHNKQRNVNKYKKF